MTSSQYPSRRVVDDVFDSARPNTGQLVSEVVQPYCLREDPLSPSLLLFTSSDTGDGARPPLTSKRRSEGKLVIGSKLIRLLGVGSRHQKLGRVAGMYKRREMRGGLRRFCEASNEVSLWL